MADDAGMDNPHPACVINCVAYARNGKRRDISLDEISDVLAVDDGSFVWVGLYEPTEDLLDKLQEEFSLHDLAIEDATPVQNVDYEKLKKLLLSSGQQL